MVSILKLESVERKPRPGRHLPFVVVLLALTLLSGASGSALPVPAAVVQPVLDAGAVSIASEEDLPAPPSLVGGTPLWTARYNEGANDIAEAIAVSPAGDRVFVTGGSFVLGTWQQYVTLAYDALTGQRLWKANYNGEASLSDIATAIALSPLGDRVFVTGYSFGWSNECPGCGALDYVTLAYDAATGEQLWEHRYRGPGGVDEARDLKVSPDGTRVYVTGYSDRGTGDIWGLYDYATVAYDAENGDLLWEARFGSDSGNDLGQKAALSADGAVLFVTGMSWSAATEYDLATVAYDTQTGAELWVARYDHEGRWERAGGIALSADGTRVYVTGDSESAASRQDIATVAYAAESGAEIWTARLSGTSLTFDSAAGIVAAPTGDRLYVAGTTANTGTGRDFTVIGYDGATGAEVWRTTYDGTGTTDIARGIALGPGGSRVYVTGYSWGAGNVQYEFTTLGIDAAKGSLLWDSRFDNGIGARDYGVALAMDPSGLRVYATGFSSVDPGATVAHEYKTIAYVVDELSLLDALGGMVPQP